MKPTLIILAAGIGSRYGGIKQLDQFGPNGETIIDFSLFDAIRAGFGKVVFVIREELHEEFVKRFEPKLRGKIGFDFAFQKLDSYLPEEIKNINRNKPWGTGHALLCAWPYTQTSFCVINADDFYGYGAYKTMAGFLSSTSDPKANAMIGYLLKNTLSENGTVSRGVCFIDDQGYLKEVTERRKIQKDESDKIAYYDYGHPVDLAPDTIVSMNFWGCQPEIFPIIEKMFHEYALEHHQEAKAEFYIPKVVSHIIEKQLGSYKVFDTDSDWYGLTYPQDRSLVKEALEEKIAQGEYDAENVS